MCSSISYFRRRRTGGAFAAIGIGNPRIRQWAKRNSLTPKDLRMIIGQLREPFFLADSILPRHSLLLHGFIIKPLVKEKL
jgi:hypothetical protein